MEKLKEKAYIDIIVRGTGRFYIFFRKVRGCRVLGPKTEDPGDFFWANPD
jgi:hypothetical protein